MSRRRVLRRAVQFGALALLVALGFVATRRTAPPPAHGVGAPTAVAASAASVASAAFARAEASAQSRTSRLKVAFQLDPALTQSLYLGQRWVSPPTFDFAQPGRQFVVLAKAQRVDAAGERQDVSGDWATSNPEMVAITRGPGDVTLAIREAGESDLVVQAAGERRVLHVHAEQRPDAMRVRITQP